MVRQNKEVHKRVELENPETTLKMGMLSSTTGTATCGTEVKLITGAPVAKVDPRWECGTVVCDGYLTVEVGGTIGYIPIFESRQGI